MKNSIGESIILTIMGESHGEAIGAVLDGLAPGINVDFDFIDLFLAKRRPNSVTDTARVEKDEYKIISGVFNGYTTGTPVCVIIPNGNTDSSSYEKIRGKARPSHADYSAFVKYHGFEDYRGGGHFSGRITAPIVALGAICIKALENIGIRIGTHIFRCGNISDRSFDNYDEDFNILEKKMIPLLTENDEMLCNEIQNAKNEMDSIGGITETAVTGLPAGLGDPWFSSVEGMLSNAMFSIGGIKGVEFGLGFGFSEKKGSDANDVFRIKDKKIVTDTNNNGGINGGITNGMPVFFRCAVKPTPSIAKKQETIDFLNLSETCLEIKGRHDPAIIRRICPVISSLTAIVISDIIALRYGTDYLSGIFNKKDGTL